MHLQIIELDSRGHRLVHVRKSIEAVLPIVDHVTLSLGVNMPKTEEFRIQLGPFSHRVQLDASTAVAPNERNDLRTAWRYLRAVHNSIRRVGPDHVWMPTADLTTQGLGAAASLGENVIPAGIQAEGVLHRCSPAYPASSRRRRLKTRVVAELLRRAPWTALHTVDRVAYEWMQSVGGFRSEVWFLPDPIEAFEPVEKTQARRRLGIPESGRYVGTAGALDGRKGVDLLLNGFQRAGMSRDDRILLVGRGTPAVESLIHARSKEAWLVDRIIWIDRFVSDEEFMLSLAAMDVVCTPSAGHIGISNTLLRAQCAARPVLGCHDGWQARIIPALGLGWCCDVEDAGVFGRAMRASLEEAADRTVSEAAKRLVRFHSFDNYASWVTRRLRRRLKLEEASGAVDWSWVEAAAVGSKKRG